VDKGKRESRKRIEQGLLRNTSRNARMVTSLAGTTTAAEINKDKEGMEERDACEPMQATSSSPILAERIMASRAAVSWRYPL